MNLENQKKMIESLGSIDGQLRMLDTVIENLQNEQDLLLNQRHDLLLDCEHVDEEGNLVLAGGGFTTWCQICGNLLDEDEIAELEKEHSEEQK